MISIIILAHNQLASTKRCLNSLFKYTAEPYNLVLVNNGSTDSTKKYFEEIKCNFNKVERAHSAYIFEYEKNNGFIVPNNAAIDFAFNDDVLLLNNDIEILQGGWLKKLYEVLYSSNEIGLVYPLNRTRGIKYCGGLIKNRKEMLLNYDTEEKDIEPTWAQFSCVLIKREVFNDIGNLDERFGFGYFEDVDFCLRMKDAGYKLKLVPELIVEHYQSVTSSSLKLNDLRYSNRDKFYEKWNGKF